MRIVRDIAELRGAAAAAGPVAFVPTWGTFHEGHLSLARLARSRAGAVVVSIFRDPTAVRPPARTSSAIPGPSSATARLSRPKGWSSCSRPMSASFIPSPQTYFVRPAPIADELERPVPPGLLQRRRDRGAKLLNACSRRSRIFGKKDYQQLHIVRGMVRQLDLPVEIVRRGRRLREPDGLAMSSRNNYLSAAERAEAPRLFRILEQVKAGKMTVENSLQALTAAGWKPDYVAIRRRSDLAPANAGDREKVVLAAAKLGATRLIDSVEF